MPRARAVVITESGGPEVLSLGETDVRDPGPHELLVRVHAAGLNRADTLQRRGFYPAPKGAPADVPGLEYAGTVEATGRAVSRFSVGDEVMGIAAGGAMATHLVTHEREAIPVPDDMDLTVAGGVPEVWLTAYDALFRQAQVGLGSRVLIHAVASGVGTAAVQLVKHAGGVALGTSRSAAKLERMAALGLDHGIHTTKGEFAATVRDAVGGVDVILDTVGGAYLGENVAALAPGGTMVVIGLMGGVKGELPLGVLLGKRLSIIGSVLRARPLEEKAALSQAFTRAVLPSLTDGTLRPVIDTVMPMSEVAEAHRRMDANETFGKIVLTWE
ncbi:MAG: NAD(P)H-quinone oxidoreductase [Deltaproteobacteria bacterium]|nr:MAG: NAD(P)H-quinone oxidoreductase [Deltaproteobacteria bacterium]